MPWSETPSGGPSNWYRDLPHAGSGSGSGSGMPSSLLFLSVTLSSLFLSKIHRVYELRLTDPPRS